MKLVQPDQQDLLVQVALQDPLEIEGLLDPLVLLVKKVSREKLVLQGLLVSQDQLAPLALVAREVKLDQLDSQDLLVQVDQVGIEEKQDPLGLLVHKDNQGHLGSLARVDSKEPLVSCIVFFER